jgi:hypothetical protein
MMKRLTVDELNLEGQPGAFAGTLMNSSADLVTRVCQGDSEAFRLIFERYSRPVISFIFDMVNDRALAEELTQETFVRAYRAIRTMRRETSSRRGSSASPETSPANPCAPASAPTTISISLISQSSI